MKANRRHIYVLLAFATVLAVLAAVVVMLNTLGEARIADSAKPLPASQQLIERGRYLALAGNCAGCHTERGGAAYAGGRSISTPFGIIYTSNLTPDPRAGIGLWSADHFWRAMHNGRSRDGRLLYPAFPYTSYTQVTREDSDAIYAWLQTLPPVSQGNRAHALDFPYNTQAALAVWRALFFRPGAYEAQARRSPDWNRGAYLVGGLGHCIACHGSRNVLGATNSGRGLGGGPIPGQSWYAPALDDPAEAGTSHWQTSDIVALLKTGITASATVSGPMADVVYQSTQYLDDADLHAIAVYLKDLPDHAQARQEAIPVQSGSALMQRGDKVYSKQCASCHGEQGEGKVGMFPALAGNRAVKLGNPANLIQMVLFGGYAPSTKGNPRPYGMPPFGHVLTDEDVSAVLTYVRGSWGNNAPEVSLLQVVRR
ncbi:c-type cytochrome [Comamonas guangdongensis]|uniref:Cytochrome c n=1 Tax=Comamonas guangdongensis TaxID=510515 RepID=A0ABV3ZT90_9BURK